MLDIGVPGTGTSKMGRSSRNGSLMYRTRRNLLNTVIKHLRLFQSLGVLPNNQTAI